MQTIRAVNVGRNVGMRVEKRRARRAIVARSMRVRPSGPEDAAFEDTPISVNASSHGVYFTTRRRSYYQGMHLLLTFPFVAPGDSMNRDYLAQVARVPKPPNGRIGVGVKLLLDLTHGTIAKPSVRGIA